MVSLRLWLRGPETQSTDYRKDRRQREQKHRLVDLLIQVARRDHKRGMEYRIQRENAKNKGDRLGDLYQHDSLPGHDQFTVNRPASHGPDAGP